MFGCVEYFWGRKEVGIDRRKFLFCSPDQLNKVGECDLGMDPSLKEHCGKARLISGPNLSYHFGDRFVECPTFLCCSPKGAKRTAYRTDIGVIGIGVENIADFF